MTAIEYMEKETAKHRANYDRETARGASEEMLRNIEKKISHYEAAVDALKNEESKEIVYTLRTDKFKKIKDDAIKEFAENVKKNHLAIFNTIYSHTHFCEMIDNLVKEMTEGENET